ncbi:MAG: outer membrane protein assembly factor BamE [Verrucomicrobia subdivision 3 bacterium]|nr:outer membrane protein assembly factor BamE [Limisphaerales bacterium]
MKKILPVIAIAFFLILLTGCKTGWIKPSKMSQISVGMTKPEVIRILGTPHSSEGRQGSEKLWYLEDQGNWIHIYHFVELTDGKVVAYGLGKGDENRLMQPTAPNSSNNNGPGVAIPIK